MWQKDLIARCRRCGGEWRVFKPAGTVEPSAPPAARNAASVPTAIVGEPQIIETGRRDEPYYEDRRVLDNRGGTTTATQTISVSEQWTQTVQLERVDDRTGGGRLSLGAPQFISIEASAERAVRHAYSLSESRQQTYTAELTIEVPPRAMRTLVLSYRRVWREGVVRIATSTDAQVQVPFRVALSLAMDWSQHDEVGV